MLGQKTILGMQPFYLALSQSFNFSSSMPGMLAPGQSYNQGSRYAGAPERALRIHIGNSMPGMPNLFTNCNPGGTYESGYAQACLFNRHVGMRAEKKEAITTWHFKIGAAVPLALFTALIARIIDTPAPVGRVQYKSSEIPGGTTLAGTG